jgi:hypothetical protein
VEDKDIVGTTKSTRHRTIYRVCNLSKEDMKAKLKAGIYFRLFDFLDIE